MHFDATALSEIIERHAARVAAYYKGHDRYPLRMKMHPRQGEDRFECIAFAIKERSISSHRRLQRDVFVNEAIEDTKDLEAWLRQTYPALDTPCLSFEIEVLSPAKRGDCFKFNINGAGKTSAAVQIRTLTNWLKVLHDHLAPLKAPTRQFLVNEIPVRAACPASALRVILALHRPELFGVDDPDTNNQFTVSEICNVTAADAINIQNSEGCTQ